MTNSTLPPQITKAVPETTAVTAPGPNPANRPPLHEQIASGRRKRVPVSNGRRKLEVPEIPGFSLYWFLERNVQAALEGGYQFVDSQETVLNQHGLANATDTNGNTDLGSRVSIGTTGPDGGERLYLMKIKLEWFNEDQLEIHQRNKAILTSIFRDEFIFDPQQGQGSAPAPRQDPNTYFHESNQFAGNAGSRALFSRGRRKAKD
jgi:hypothetical protein